jgi:hypothetical protein
MRAPISPEEIELCGILLSKNCTKRKKRKGEREKEE